jgi:hypothetical protein
MIGSAFAVCNSDIWLGPCLSEFHAAMEELDFLVLNCQDDAVGDLSDGIDSVIFQIVLPECIDEYAKVAVGRVGFV